MSSQTPKLASFLNPKLFGRLKPLSVPLPLIPYNSDFTFPGVNTEQWKSMRNTFSTRSNDVLLNSYPKAGNHFLKKCCIEIIRAADKENTHQIYKTGDIGQDSVPHIEFQHSQLTSDEFENRIKYTENINPCFYWYHGTVNHIGCKDFESINTAPNINEYDAENVLKMKGKTVIIVRNPKDVIVSGYYFWSALAKDINLASDNDPYTFDDYISYFYRGIMQNGCYFEWMNEWWSLYSILNKISSGENDKILWLYYEDLIDKPHENIRKLAKFIGKDKTLNDIEYNNICETIKFKNVKAEISKNAHSFELPGLMRSGTNNNWEDIMSEKDSGRVDEMMFFKWAQYSKDIRYYQELMQQKKFKDANFGYHNN